MKTVSTRKKNMIRKYRLEGYTLSEIAKMTNTSRSTVYYHCKALVEAKKARREQGLGELQEVLLDILKQAKAEGKLQELNEILS